MEQEDREYEILLAAYKNIFESDNGKLVLKDLLNTYQERTSLHENPYVVVANEGKRFVVLQILAKIEEANNGRRNSSSTEFDEWNNSSSQ